MSDLIFLGGAKGIGKSTVLKELLKEYKIDTVNTGNIYLAAKRDLVDPELAIVMDLSNRNYSIVDTHYAGYFKNGFVRGLSKENLLKLSNKKSLAFILMEIDEKELLRRREKDCSTERIHNSDHLRKELEMNHFYFNQYCKDLSAEGTIIINRDIEKSKNKILELLK